jgi:hypothetical protein
MVKPPTRLVAAMVMLLVPEPGKIPEPAAGAMLLSGLALLAALARRRARRG